MQCRRLPSNSCSLFRVPRRAPLVSIRNHINSMRSLGYCTVIVGRVQLLTLSPQPDAKRAARARAQPHPISGRCGITERARAGSSRVCQIFFDYQGN